MINEGTLIAWMPVLVMLSGLGQLALCAVSLIIPWVLEWDADTRRLKPLTRYVFWTYAGYIFTTNLAFGLLSLFAPSTLLSGTLLAAFVAGFIAFYWAARIVIQFIWFTTANEKQALFFRLAEGGLVLLFFFLTFVYVGATAFNLIHMT